MANGYELSPVQFSFSLDLTAEDNDFVAHHLYVLGDYVYHLSK